MKTFSFFSPVCLALFIFSTGFSTGCKPSSNAVEPPAAPKKVSKTPTKTTNNELPKSEPKPSVDYKTPAPPADKTLVELVDAALKACDFQGDPIPKKCKNAERKRIDKRIEELGPPALNTLTVITSDKNPQKRDLGAWLTQNIYDTSKLDADAKFISEPLRLRLQEIVARADISTATRMAPVTTHITALKSELDTWLPKLQEKPRNAVLVHIYRNLMTFGRMEAFPQIQKITGDKKQPAIVRRAAFQAPNHMQNWSKDERARLCPWYGEYLEEKKKMFRRPILLGYGKCDRDANETLLKIAQKELETHAYADAMAQGLAQICVTPEARKKKREVCKQTRQLFEQALQSKWLDPKNRSHALDILTKQWPDARTSNLAKVLSKENDPHLKQSARTSIEAIEAVFQKTAPPR